uniref:Protein VERNALIZATION INSENSITIVE 3 n=1 Tax=Anthurium amnicola TaxID=1678845 RepID=A0A1D1Y1D3_9ARAE
MRSLGSDPSFAGVVIEPSKCGTLSKEEKRGLVYELSKWTQGAPELLQSWSRRDLLEILCLEMGKERKYTGLTKYKIIENLLKIVSEKKSGTSVEDIDTASPPPNPAPPSKRHRKNAHPSRLPVGANCLLEAKSCEDASEPQYCQNIACRAVMTLTDAFCKRCSCCICHKYDDNKDPSLWLVCDSEAPSQDNFCGMSCHLECALKHEKAGIARSDYRPRLEGSFHCVSCGKVNDLLRCWRMQLSVAKDARRVDVLCYRLSLCHKLLNGTQKYQNLHDIVDSAVKKLEAEIGVLDGSPFKMARGIVNRLSSGIEVQKLCAAAIMSLDSMLSPVSHLSFPPRDQKSCTPVWEAEMTTHKIVKANMLNLSTNGDASKQNSKSLESNGSGLSYPSECYESNDQDKLPETSSSPFEKPDILGLGKISCSEDTCIDGLHVRNEAAEAEKMPDHSVSGPNAPNSTILTDSQKDSTNTIDLNQTSDAPKSENESDAPPGNEIIAIPYGCSETIPTFTPSKLETLKEIVERVGRTKPRMDGANNKFPRPEKELHLGSSSKKRSGARGEEQCDKDRSLEGDYEYCVKVVRWLECEGYIEAEFRVKFLTWFSLRATPQEQRVASVFVDTMIDDPASLAGQLIDTFSEGIHSKASLPLRTGFCAKLWH